VPIDADTLKAERDRLKDALRELGSVDEGQGWLGVDPMVNWDLGILGPVG